MTLHLCSLPYCGRCESVANAIADKCEAIRQDPLALADAFGYIPESVFGAGSELMAALSDCDTNRAGRVLWMALEEAITQKATSELERNSEIGESE